MKKLGVACVLIVFTIGAQLATAAEKKTTAADPVCDDAARSGSALTVQGNMANESSSASQGAAGWTKGGGAAVGKCAAGSSGSIPVLDKTSASSGSVPQPLDDQKIKTKSNIKND